MPPKKGGGVNPYAFEKGKTTVGKKAAAPAKKTTGKAKGKGKSKGM